MKNSNFPSISIVGATGAVGKICLDILNERDYPVEKINLFASTNDFQKNTTVRYINNRTTSLNNKKKYLLITSIANPNSIYEYLNENKVQFTAKKYRDHQNFTNTQIQEIITISKEHDAFITTEKDWMRLKETELVNAVSLDILRLRMKMEFIHSKENLKFKDQITSLIK